MISLAPEGTRRWQHFDMNCVEPIGNHDIGHADTVSLMRSTFIPSLGNAYVTSNSLDKATGQPLGNGHLLI
jgi:hypothetical protein